MYIDIATEFHLISCSVV